MKIKLLIGTVDRDYAEHLSQILSEKHADMFEVGVCSSAERLRDLMTTNRYDAALLEPSFVSAADLNFIRLPFVLIGEEDAVADDSGDLRKIKKYQRISAIIGHILEQYAELGNPISGLDINSSQITAVWSASGGSGKTTVALAYAAHQVAVGKQATYLSLESFSSGSAYFQENGRSISKAFEKLETNLPVFLRGIRQQDSGSGIMFFGEPENYDDMNILTVKDYETLINACAAEMNDLIVDLPGQCDERVQKVFALADTILLVYDASSTSLAKLKQFVSQHNVFETIRDKTVLVSNKNARTLQLDTSKTIQLPLIQSADAISVFKALSSDHFNW